jgi:hypothetical protein
MEIHPDGNNLLGSQQTGQYSALQYHMIHQQVYTLNIWD